MIDVPAISDTNRYSQNLQINGQPWTKPTLPHALAHGATLDFVMGPKPSAWDSEASSLPASLAPEGKMPKPMRDLTGIGQIQASSEPAMDKLDALFDNDSETEAALSVGGSSASWHFPQAREVTMVTLTSGGNICRPVGLAAAGVRRWQVVASSGYAIGGKVFFPSADARLRHPAAGQLRVYRLSFPATRSAARALVEIEWIGPTESKDQ